MAFAGQRRRGHQAARRVEEIGAVLGDLGGIHMRVPDGVHLAADAHGGVVRVAGQVFGSGHIQLISFFINRFGKPRVVRAAEEQISAFRRQLAAGLQHASDGKAAAGSAVEQQRDRVGRNGLLGFVSAGDVDDPRAAVGRLHRVDQIDAAGIRAVLVEDGADFGALIRRRLIALRRHGLAVFDSLGKHPFRQTEYKAVDGYVERFLFARAQDFLHGKGARIARQGGFDRNENAALRSVGKVNVSAVALVAAVEQRRGVRGRRRVVGGDGKRRVADLERDVRLAAGRAFGLRRVVFTARKRRRQQADGQKQRQQPRKGFVRV